MTKPCLLALMMLASGGGGCNQSAPPAPAPPPVAAQYPALPTHAQGKLKTAKIWLGAEQMDAELALNPIEQQTGMMFRTNLEEQAGMLFVFSFPQRASFWMKNCPLPLSAAYIDPEGVILEIHDLQPQNTNTVEAATDRVQYVLETSQGWFARHNVTTGAVIRTERGSLSDSFQQDR